MPLTSYFYDSVVGDPRNYSAVDFARAFDIMLENGVLIRETQGGTLGFDIGGTNYTTVYEGKAVINGHLIELTGTEIITVPPGDYAGQLVIRMDADDTRDAVLLVKQDRNPVDTTNVYELPLYNLTVAAGIITAAADIRYQGGAVPNNHIHAVADTTGLQSALDARTTWSADLNGVSIYMGKYNGTGKPIRLFLTSAQPGASATEHRVWIQIDNF
jgi:hypothetical protein